MPLMKTFIWAASRITILAQAIIQNGLMITTGAAMAGYSKRVIKPLPSAVAVA
jgi:hypothetical protein